MNKFLPISKKDMQNSGINQLDFICVTGDAYVDHPSFGVSIISRIIEAQGYKVGVIAQPNWESNKDFTELGEPKYGFFVGSGNVDSMVNNYTVALRKRNNDDYSAGGVGGKRPDRAVKVYCQKIRENYPNTNIIIGGIEASLRRFAHYDYWEDKILPSILYDSVADLLVYGMSEKQTIEIANRLAKGENIKSITDVKGTTYVTEPVNTPIGAVQCPSLDEVISDKLKYAKSCKQLLEYHDEIRGRILIQRHKDKMVVQNPPMESLTTEEMDYVASLPYAKTYHPNYEKVGGVPAIREVEFSVTHNRGCFGHCNFCAIALHQGRVISTRSENSVIKEIEEMTQKENFKGYVHDIGGPTANFRDISCDKQKKVGMCKHKKCLAPKACSQLKVDHSEYLQLLRKARKVKSVKKVFIRSGIRYDYLMEDKNDEFFKELVEHHVSGQLKVAPEHCSPVVLEHMGKPEIESFKKFADKYFKLSKQAGKEQYLVPYLMSSHPGSTLKDAIEVALFIKKQGLRPEQVQDFYPTPGTISTCMFYTGIDPITMEKVYVPKDPEEKAMQRALLQYFNPKNKHLVIKALMKSGRKDLIGFSKDCLVTPDKKHIAESQKTQPKTKRKPIRNTKQRKKK